MSSTYEAVISGISGEFPECDNVAAFRDKLYSRKSFMSLDDKKWPTNYRYKYTEETIPAAIGKLQRLIEFDIATFRIHYSIATCTDMVNRKSLEASFEAVMDAGVNPYDLSGRNIGVYMAFSHSECDATGGIFGIGGKLWVLGSSKTMMANRISFALNLTGPSYTFHNDLLGNLTALDQAYKDIKQGHTEAAIVGVANIVQEPMFALQLCKMNLLSMDAVTRVFDKNANGYGRSDAVVALFIQKAEDAKRVYGFIDFIGSTYYGSNPNSLLAYEEELLKSSLIDLYTNSNYENIGDLSFVEMSACGIKKYDRVEANVMADVLCKKRNTPLLVGSVKSNMGNAGGAAPFVGLIKAILALESGVIAPNINFENLNDEIRAFTNNKLKVVSDPTKLTNVKVAVNSVGLAGALGQVILRQNPKEKIPGGSVKDTLPRLVLFCGRNEKGSQAAIKKIQQTPFNTDFISLANDVFHTNMPFHIYRGYTILSSDVKYLKKSTLEVKGNTKRPVWFVFSGMGSQWNGMANGLLDVPIFAETVQKCHETLKSKGLDIYHIITTDDPTIFDNILHAFVGIITIQIALVDILKTLGIEPDGIIGHSAGESACAYADGCLTLEQAVLSSYARGIASNETETIKGMMAAIGKGYNEIKDSLPPNIEIACHNSSTNCTISGPADEVNDYVKQLQDENVFAKTVNAANIAYHSKYIAPAAPNLLAHLQEAIPKPTERSSKWISTSIPENEWDKPLAKYCSAEYLTNNLIHHVLFEEGCKHIPQDALVVEIAPHGLLQPILKRSLPNTCTNISLTRRNNEDKNIENLLTAIGQLYIAGCDVNINALYPPIQYPVPRETPSIASLAVWNREMPHDGIIWFDFKGSHTGDRIPFSINDDSPHSYLKHHKINNEAVLPTSLFLYVTWYVFSINQNVQLGSQPIIFENIHFLKNTLISQLKPKSFTFNINKGSGKFEILKEGKSDEKSTLIMTGMIYQPSDDPNHKISKTRLQNMKFTVNKKQFYNVLKNVGYQLNDPFCSLEELKYNEKEYYGKIIWNKNWVSFLDALLKFSMFSDMKNETDLLYTRKIEKIEISAAYITSLAEGSMIICHKESTTKLITCDGVMMKNVTQQPYVIIKPKNKGLELEGLRFVSHKNPRCKNIAEFLKLCLQIAVENTITMVKKKNPKLHVIGILKEFSKSIKQIVKNCDTLQSKIFICQEKDELFRNQYKQDNCFFIVTDNIKDVRRFDTNSIFLLLVAQQNESIFNDVDKSYIKIIEQSFSEKNYCLFKKKPLIIPTLIIEDDDWSSDDVLDKNNEPGTFILKRNIELDDLSLMFSEDKKPTDLRYLYVTDAKITSNASLENQLNQNLPIAVLQNGEWGSYRAITEQLPKFTYDTKQASDRFMDARLQGINIQYLSPENNAECERDKYGIEYSGLQQDGEKIMGLSLVNTSEQLTTPDSYFIWKVPKNWSLEDAVTVPFIYAQAYNMLRYRGNVPSKTILINVGKEGLLAEACISISLSRKFIVYVTVPSSKESFILKQKFPQIDKSHIFIRKDCHYEIELLKITTARKVGIVVNCLPGIQNITASLNCVANFGLCYHVGDANSMEMDSIGMWPFLNSISFVIIPKKISALVQLCKIDKKRLHKCVEEGIKSGVVKPFERNVQIRGMSENIPKSDQQNYIKTVYKCFPQNGLCCITNQKIRFDKNHSYIIVGGEKKDSYCIELVEWMITKGAQKFIIAVHNYVINSKTSHQMSRLLNQKKVTIILTSSQKVATVQNSAQLIEEANNIAPLEAIFFVSMESACQKISNTDAALRDKYPNVHLISIFSGGLKECEIRRYKGFPALVIHDDKKSQKLSTVLPLIEDLLFHFNNSNSPTLYRLIDTNSRVKKANKGIRNYLPYDIKTLEIIGDDLTDTIEFIEVTTLSPRFSYLKEITPIFVISAFGPKPLQGLFSKLTFPAFCATVVNFEDTAAEIASKLYNDLNRIQSKEGVSLLVETWLYPVGLELSHLLEREERKYKLFTLEGNPSIWKEQIKTLGLVNSLQFENNLIKQLFSDDSTIPTERLLNSYQPLQEKLREYLSLRNYSSLNVLNLAKVVGAIRNGLTFAYRYDLKGQLIKHTVLIGQSFIDEGILNFATSSEQFVHEEDDYNKFICSIAVSQKINDNVINNTWYNNEYKF